MAMNSLASLALPLTRRPPAIFLRSREKVLLFDQLGGRDYGAFRNSPENAPTDKDEGHPRVAGKKNFPCGACSQRFSSTKKAWTPKKSTSGSRS